MRNNRARSGVTDRERQEIGSEKLDLFLLALVCVAFVL